MILICTKSDKFESSVEDEIKRMYMKKHNLKRKDVASSTHSLQIEEQTAKKIEERKQDVVEKFSQFKDTPGGPIYVSDGMNQQVYLIVRANSKPDDPDSITSVMTETIGSIDNAQVRLICIAAQTCSIDIKIEASIKESVRLYKHGIRTVAVPGYLASIAGTSSVGGLISQHILDIFGFTGISLDLAIKIIGTALTGNKRLYAAEAAAAAANIGAAFAPTGLGLPAAAIIFGGATMTSLMTVPSWGRMLLMTIVDVILIVERAYWLCEDKQIEASSMEDACQYYSNHKQATVHAEVKAILPTMNVFAAFRYDTLEANIKTLVMRHRFKKPCKFCLLENNSFLISTPLTT